MTHHCILCDYTTNNKYSWEKHLITTKHHRNEKFGGKFGCKCGKIYSHRQSLSMHKKKCTYKEPEEVKKSDMEMMCEMVKDVIQHQTITQNEHSTFMREIFAELVQNMQKKQLAIENNIDNQNNIQQQNNIDNQNNIQQQNNIKQLNNFNLQLFLNEDCKNAMNIHDFINSMEFNTEHAEQVLEKGLPKTIGSVLSHELEKLDQTTRPIHCTDLKRQTMFINSGSGEGEPEWTKDENKEIFFSKIERMANRMVSTINMWKQKYPDYDRDDDLNDRYLKLVKNMMLVLVDNKEKITRSVGKDVVPKCIINKNQAAIN